jgi:hypothetical protein
MAYDNNFKTVFGSVNCCHCQYRRLLFGDIREYAGIGIVNPGGSCGVDQCIIVFVDRNVAVMEKYL